MKQNKIKNTMSILFTAVMAWVLMMPVHNHGAAGADKLKVKKGEEVLFTFAEVEGGAKWKAKSKNLELKITRDAEKYKFSMRGQEKKFKLKRKESKFKLYDQDGKLRFKVKLYPGNEKLKISQKEDDPNAWALKKKIGDNKYKVKQGEENIGKLKFYPEKGKIKVKNAAESEVCTMKAKGLLASPVVALLPGLNEEDRLLLFAVLVIVGQEEGM